MSDELDDIVDNLRKPSAWIRVIFMLAFVVFLYLVIAPIILVLMLAQALFAVINGKENENLRYFGSALTRYVSQILEFITYNTERKPFPFADFPGAGGQAQTAATSTAVDTKKESATKKPVVREKPSKKTAAKKTTKKKTPK
jgi:hypothetical protein